MVWEQRKINVKNASAIHASIRLFASGLVNFAKRFLAQFPFAWMNADVNRLDYSERRIIMSNKRPTQCDRLIDYLKKHEKGITQVEASNELGILRLASRISELRDEGFCIAKDMVLVTNRYGEKCKVARYRLI